MGWVGWNDGFGALGLTSDLSVASFRLECDHCKVLRNQKARCGGLSARVEVKDGHLVTREVMRSLL